MPILWAGARAEDDSARGDGGAPAGGEGAARGGSAAEMGRCGRRNMHLGASALARGEVDCEEAVGVDDLVSEPLHNFGLY